LNKELMKILVCPVCKSKLGLDSIEQDGENIIKGHFCCENCGKEFQIIDGLPFFLITH
jgi:uncharacterized protein YbaR (Trm112 family)